MILNNMDVSIVIILIAVGLFVLKEVFEKLDWLRPAKRSSTPTADMMALRAGVIGTPVDGSRPSQLRNGEDGIENGVEVRWGRRSDPPDGSYTSISEDGLIPFLEKNRDYALWYKIVHIDFGGGVLEWIVSQPDCPNAVATAFLNAVGCDDLYGLTEKPAHSDYIYRAVEIISLRDSNEGFPSDTMRDPKPTENGWWSTSVERIDRSAMLEKCEAAAHAQIAMGKTPVYAVPRKLLSTIPLGPSLRSEYDVDDAGIN